MRCNEADLLGTIDGTAGDADRAHVDGCERCQAERVALERQLAILLTWYRERSPCPSTEKLVERALVGGFAELTPHLDECEECSAEWKRLEGLVERTEGAETPTVPLRPEWLEHVRARAGAAAPMDLPLAAQPDDLTDTTDEYDKRRRADEPDDDLDSDDDTEG